MSGVKGSKWGQTKYTYEFCKEESLKYITWSQMRKENECLQDAIRRNGWRDDLCGHMVESYGNEFKRCIYACFFPDNSVYVGLTFSVIDRERRRRAKGDTVTKYAEETGQPYELKQMTDYVDVVDAKRLEGVYVEKFKNEGYIILNKAKTGGLGAMSKEWTIEKCREEVKKYKSRTEVHDGNYSCWKFAKKSGVLDETFPDTKQKQSVGWGWWTEERIVEEAKKYEISYHFKRAGGGAYSKAKKLGILGKLFPKKP
jgi:hypothetical protein